MPKYSYHSCFAPGNRVHLDSPSDNLNCVVTGVLFARDTHEVRVEWVSNGTPQLLWVHHSRLELVP